MKKAPWRVMRAIAQQEARALRLLAPGARCAPIVFSELPADDLEAQPPCPKPSPATYNRHRRNFEIVCPACVDHMRGVWRRRGEARRRAMRETPDGMGVA